MAATARPPTPRSPTAGLRAGRGLTREEVLRLTQSSPPLAGRRLAVPGLPREALVATVQRGGGTIIPRDDTELRAADRVVVLVREEAVVELYRRLTPPPDGSGA